MGAIQTTAVGKALRYYAAVPGWTHGVLPDANVAPTSDDDEDAASIDQPAMRWNSATSLVRRAHLQLPELRDDALDLIDQYLLRDAGALEDFSAGKNAGKSRPHSLRRAVN